MKKTIAGLLALTMAFAAVSCGKIDEETGGEELESQTESSAGSEDDGEKGESSDGSEADGDTDEKPSDSTDSDKKPSASAAGGFVNESNTLIVDDYQDDENDPYDAGNIYLMMEKAVEQYNLIIDRDKQGYYDSLNMKALINSKGYDVLMENYDAYQDMSDTELEAYSLPIMMLYSADPDKIDELENKYNDDEPAMLNAVIEYLREGYNSITPDSLDDSELFNEFSAFSYNFTGEGSGIPEDFRDNYANYRIVPDDSTIFGIEIDSYVSNENGTFAELDMIAAGGDWEYIFDECYAWIIDGEVGVYFNNFGIEENEVKGMTLDEVKEMTKKHTDTKSVNANAKTAYNAVATYFADREVEDFLTIEEVMKNGDFQMAEGEETLGLNLALSATHDKPGDAFLFKEMHDCDITSGFVYVGMIDAENWEFFIQYIDENGVIGQYPHPIQSDDAGKVIFGTYFVPADAER